VHVHILEGIVRIGNRTVELSGREFALFALLALQAGPMTSGAIAEKLWPDVGTQAGIACARVYVNRLRKRLGDPNAIVSSKRAYARGAHVRTDIAVTTALMVFSIPGAIAASNTTQHTGRGFSLRGPLVALLRQRAFPSTALGLVAITLTWGTIGAFMPVFGREALGLPSYQVGYLLAIQAVANGASRIPAGQLIDRMRHRWPIVFAGGVGWSAVMVGLGHLTGFFWPAVFLVIGTPLMAAAFVAMGVVFADLSTASTRGVTMGVYGTVLFLGLSLGPLLFGPIVQGYGYAAGFTACAAVAIVLLLVMAAIQAEPVRPREETSHQARHAAEDRL